MITIDKLRDFGANVDEGLARCAGNEALYLRLVGLIPKDENFDRLKDALDAKELDKAFDAAHAIKGAIGNLSLTPLYDVVGDITEMTRAREDADYAPLVERLFDYRNELAGLCD